MMRFKNTLFGFGGIAGLILLGASTPAIGCEESSRGCAVSCGPTEIPMENECGCKKASEGGPPSDIYNDTDEVREVYAPSKDKDSLKDDGGVHNSPKDLFKEDNSK